MPTTNIISNAKKVGEILGGEARYSVPSFQRNYSWTTSEVQEFWEDIIATIDEGRDEHFLGAMVIDTSKSPSQLIDGQQRLATVSILMCVIRDIAATVEDSELSSLIKQRYLGTVNLRTRKIEAKLTLNELNNEFYRENILDNVDIGEITKASRKKTIHKSNKLLADAYSLLHSKISDRLEKTKNKSDVLVDIEECLKEKFIIILISVTDEANAYLIFETLNDRGLDLSVSDLLKNYLFSRAGSKLSDVQSKWSDVVRAVGKFELKKFIRHYWLSAYSLINEKELYNALKNKIQHQNEVIDFVGSLKKSSEFYGAFSQPQSPVWEEREQDFKKNLEILNLFGVNLCYTILMAAEESLKEDLCAKVLRMIVVISFRYNIICKKNPTLLEKIYSDAAKFIRDEKPTSAKSIFEKLSKAYPNDQEFKQAFSEVQVSKAGLARYILAEINNSYTEGEGLVTNTNPQQLNLEHIFPQRLQDINNYPAFKSIEFKDYIDRIGNLTLLETKPNKEKGNLPFQEKRDSAYSKSSVSITKKLIEYDVWEPDAIAKRQRELAKAAAHIWRLSY